MAGIFTDTGLFEADTAYEILPPDRATLLATVVAECQAPLARDGSGRVIMELGFGLTDDHTAVGAGLSGTQATEVTGQNTLFARCVVQQVIPAHHFATFKMTVFPKGGVTGTLVRLTINRTAV